jgi:hypothetical protein
MLKIINDKINNINISYSRNDWKMNEYRSLEYRK